MNYTVLNKRIPSLLGIGLLLMGITFSTFLVQKSLNDNSKAGPTDKPQKVLAANITDSSFTIVYSTVGQTTGSLLYGMGASPGQLALDNQDKKSNNPSSHSIHFFTISQLKPNTQYHFAIISGGSTYQEQAYIVTTAKKSNTQNGLQTVSGIVRLPDGTIPHEALISLEVDNAYPLATLASNDGTYSFDLSKLYAVGTFMPLIINNNTHITLTTTDGINTSIVNALNPTNGTFAPVVLSQNYDFTGSALTIANSGTSQTFPTQAAGIAGAGGITQLSITSPTANEAFIDSQPRFSGTAQRNATVKLTIMSTDNKITITANSSGVWQFRPPTSLAPGKYTIFVSSLNLSGVTESVSQKFNILPSGSQVDQSATPSAIPTIEVQISPTTITTPTTILTPISITPSLNPTLSVKPTISISLTSAISIAPTSSTIPTPSTPTGPGDTIVGIGIFGIILTIFGGILFIAL